MCRETINLTAITCADSYPRIGGPLTQLSKMTEHNQGTSSGGVEKGDEGNKMERGTKSHSLYRLLEELSSSWL